MNFFLIHGSNGGRFFFSTESFSDWKKSLEFYRGVSVSAKVKKFVLTSGYPILKFKSACSSGKVAETIQEQLQLPFTVSIPEHASAMISPTHDKAIIHHYGRGYEKIATGKSLDGVRKELEVYQKFQQKRPENFSCSTLGSYESEKNFIRFFMNYADGSFSEAVPKLENLLPALAEFFKYGNCHSVKWEELLKQIELPESIPDDLFQGGIPVGLVHRDFKPWNVKDGVKPLFFDFESASFEGCPLEDLFNYEIDPLIRMTSIETVCRRLPVLFSFGEKLLAIMNLSKNQLRSCWYWYLLERIHFWKSQGQMTLSEKFRKLCLQNI